MKKYFLFIIICISSFMIYTNNVKAQIYNISPTETQLNVLNKNNIGHNNCANNGCYFIPPTANQNTNFGYFHLKSGTKNFNNIGLVVFNLALIAPNGASNDYNIVDVSWGSFPCYYTVNKGSYYRSSISAYCPISNNVSLNTSTKMANFTITNMLVEQVFSSQVLLISENDASSIVTLLQQSNQYLLNDNNLLSLVNTKLDQLGDKLTTTNSNLEDIKSALNNIKNNASTTASNTEQIKNDIKSDNVSGAEGSADDLKNNSAFQDNSGLSGVISMPLTFVNSLTNTCEPINLNIPYMDVDVTIPCMQSIITNKMPLLANLIKIVVNGFIVYRILLDIFQIVRNAKNPEDDRIEVLDL